MKCPNCGQEMIDRKEYCINCGKKLYKENQVNLNKNLVIAFILMIIVGIGICYFIINYNTDKEIEPYINDYINENEA